MKEHKHAEVLRQIADGVPIDEFEVRLNPATRGWYTLENRVHSIVSCPENWEVRRKPQYIMVNGFKVPKPLDVLPVNGNIYIASPGSSSFYASGNTQYEWSRIMIARGIIHSTPEAAIAHAKAMLGIDPEWEE